MFLPHLGVKIGFVLKGQGSLYDNLEFSPSVVLVVRRDHWGIDRVKGHGELKDMKGCCLM